MFVGFGDRDGPQNQSGRIVHAPRRFEGHALGQRRVGVERQMGAIAARLRPTGRRATVVSSTIASRSGAVNSLQI